MSCAVRWFPPQEIRRCCGRSAGRDCEEQHELCGRRGTTAQALRTAAQRGSGRGTFHALHPMCSRTRLYEPSLRVQRVDASGAFSMTRPELLETVTGDVAPYMLGLDKSGTLLPFEFVADSAHAAELVSQGLMMRSLT
eukprot:47138-Eustigmatos_ZCMA.PRE.1